MNATRFLIVFLALGLGSSMGFAQGDGANTIGDATASVQNAGNINYTVGDLAKMDKLQLTDIYIAKITRLQNIIPFIPFHKLEPQVPNDLRIPATSANEKALKALKADRDNHNQTLAASLTGLVPYADKENLIGAILFIQSIINKVELIGLGMDNLSY